MRGRNFLAAGFSILLIGAWAWAQGSVRVGGGGVRGGFGAGGHFPSRPAPSARGVIPRGAALRTFGTGVRFHPRHFNNFFFASYAGDFPYEFYFPYSYGYAPECRASCCGGSGVYYPEGESENSGEVRAYHAPVRSGPAPSPSDPEVLRAALARRYPRHVIVHFNDSGLVKGETPLEIPARPHPTPSLPPGNP